MAFLDLSAISAAFGFAARRADLVVTGAGFYAVVFAVQSFFTAMAAGQGAPGFAAPLALLLALLAFVVFILVLAGWQRAALSLDDARGIKAFAFGADEKRLLWVVVLVLILLITVMGTAVLMLAFMLGALAIIGAQRTGMIEPPEGFVNIFSLFAPGEWIVAIILIAAFAGFNIWFFARLGFAAPATVARGRVQVLAAWPLSHGTVSRIVFTTLAASLPGLGVLALYNIACAALLGVFPASAVSLTNADGALQISPWAYGLMAAPYGVLKMAALGAPLSGLFSALYERADAEAVIG